MVFLLKSATLVSSQHHLCYLHGLHLMLHAHTQVRYSGIKVAAEKELNSDEEQLRQDENVDTQPKKVKLWQITKVTF